MTLSEISLPGTKADWAKDMQFPMNGLSLVQINLEITLYITLQTEIGQKWPTSDGSSVLGIRIRLDLATCVDILLVEKKYFVFIHSCSFLYICVVIKV